MTTKGHDLKLQVKKKELKLDQKLNIRCFLKPDDQGQNSEKGSLFWEDRKASY